MRRLLTGNQFEQGTAIASCAAAGTSLLCSSLISYIILSDAKNKLAHMYQRLLLALSLCDVISSLNVLLFRWMDSNNQAIGTCKLSAFLTHFSVCTGVYNACLCLYFMFVICYQWTPRRFQTSKVEHWMHLISLGWPLSFAIAGLATDSFGELESMGGICHYAGGAPHIFKLEMAGFAAPALLAGLVIFYAMTRIVIVVRRQETKQQFYDFSSSLNANANHGSRFRQTREAAKQAALFVLAHALTFLPYLILAVMVFMTGSQTPRILYPMVAPLFFLQGFWNLISKYYTLPPVPQSFVGLICFLGICTIGC